MVKHISTRLVKCHQDCQHNGVCILMHTWVEKVCEKKINAMTVCAFMNNSLAEPVWYRVVGTGRLLCVFMNTESGGKASPVNDADYNDGGMWVKKSEKISGLI